MIFTEYLDFLEKKHGYGLVDQVISQSQLASGGAYTSVGTYDFSEMVELLTKSSQLTNVPVPFLMKEFGKYTLPVFHKSYPKFFEGAKDAFDFLATLEDKIHPQVLKLYPDAELPKFEITETPDSMVMVYSSSRRMADFAEGLIEGCLEHFGEVATLSSEKLSEDGSKVRFTIRK